MAISPGRMSWENQAKCRRASAPDAPPSKTRGRRGQSTPHLGRTPGGNHGGRASAIRATIVPWALRWVRLAGLLSRRIRGLGGNFWGIDTARLRHSMALV